MEKIVHFPDLRRRILAYYNTMADVADAINISAVSLSNKLNKKSPWRLNDITVICNLLELDNSEIPFYFL